MKTNRFIMKQHFVMALAVFVLAGWVFSGTSQAAFPEKGKTLTLVVPFSAGGSTDTAARNLAPYLEKVLGIPVEVVDKPGAGSQVGVTYALSQKPDGYTIFYANLPAPMTMWLNPDRKTVFKSKKDFTLLGIHLSDPGAIAVQYDGPYKSMKDLVDAAKANPGKLKAATTGLLSDDHFAIIDVEKTAGIKFATVHFDSNPERDTALMGGKIDASFGNAGSFYAASVNKKLRIIGLMDTKPWPKAPELPTFESQGYKLYAASVRGWYAPGGMDPEVRKVLCNALKKAVNDPEHQARMDKAGFPVGYQSCEEHEKTWDRIDAWVTPIFKEAYADSKK
ncbi:MAG: tripartite tricarboxylate transporter substrate binding protein [Thermodesulfobacteriota bacterium]